MSDKTLNPTIIEELTEVFGSEEEAKQAANMALESLKRYITVLDMMGIPASVIGTTLQYGVAMLVAFDTSDRSIEERITTANENFSTIVRDLAIAFVTKKESLN